MPPLPAAAKEMECSLGKTAERIGCLLTGLTPETYMEGENLLQLSSDLHVHFTTHEYPFMCTKHIKRHNKFHEVTISKKTKPEYN